MSEKYFTKPDRPFLLIYTDTDDFSKVYFDYDVVENLSSYDEFYKNLTKTVKSCLMNYEIKTNEELKNCLKTNK